MTTKRESDIDDKYLQIPVWVMKGVFLLAAGIVPWAIWSTSSLMTLQYSHRQLEKLEVVVESHSKDIIDMQRRVDRLYFQIDPKALPTQSVTDAAIPSKATDVSRTN